MTRGELVKIRRAWLDEHAPYSLVRWDDFNYKILDNIMYIKRSGRGSHESYNDCIIMADTETSKKRPCIPDEPFYNEILSELKNMTFQLNSKYYEVANYHEFFNVGMKFAKAGISRIDVYYEDLRTRYPWIFKHDAYSDVDACYWIYDYMLNNKPKRTEHEGENHVVAFTISIRAFNRNIVTLYGNKPSECIEAMQKIHEAMKGDRTIFYFHNYAYDYVFLRKFMFKAWGTPDKVLNTKVHYPIYMCFENGIVFKDSLILAQRSLDKWAKDLNVEHQKAIGKWDYDAYRDQEHEFTQDELEYIEHDTLAGVECIQKTMDTLHKKIYSLPYTATGIPREECRIRGREFKARDMFERVSLSFEQYLKILNVYHGGYTHANRHYINSTVTGLVQCYDFSSSYPFTLLSERYPAEKFTPFKDCTIKEIQSMMDNYAFMFKLVTIKPRLKDDFEPMPTLQVSKCTKILNECVDNGRVLCASYVESYMTEQDVDLFERVYDYDYAMCTEVEVAHKDYLPRWFTDYVFELYRDKTLLKGGDPVLYSIKKATLNSLYGMCVQKSIRDDVIEDYETGDYTIEENCDEEAYNKYLENHNSILPYQWGVWVTAYAMHNLIDLGRCCETWLYSDTDSCYGMNWDNEKLSAYNERCKDKLRRNNYGCILFQKREYWLGIAEPDAQYSEYKVQGAKRYCGRSTEDGELHITVAGVPKRGYECLNNNIDNFMPGFVFSGTVTGKKLHTYYYVDDIYIDENGNETGDSIDLNPCDYLLDSVYTFDWVSTFNNEIAIQVYEEE